MIRPRSNARPGGAFFTPEALVRHLADWAVCSGRDRVLEPSCGEGVFLLAAAARERLRAAGGAAQVTVGDFFCLEPTGDYDAVIGNPPYLRYHDFSGKARERAQAATRRAGVTLTRAGLLVGGVQRPRRRVSAPRRPAGLVLPGELLTVGYAGPVREFLMRRFARVQLVMFDERVFPDVVQEVVLLVAEGYCHGPAEHLNVYWARNATALSRASGPRRWRPERPGAKWRPAALAASALASYSQLAGGADVTPLGSWGKVRNGAVTGAVTFFALSPARVAELGLTPSDLAPLCPPGSAHLGGLAFTPAVRTQLGRSGERIWLFRPPGGASPAGRRYLEIGEAERVPEVYKCRIHRPWWRAPLTPPPDLLISYGSTDTARLCHQPARAHHLNSTHGLFLTPEHGRLGGELLPLGSLNSVTLGAELVGRASGGGMLKLEPSEAAMLPVPAPALLTAARRSLSRLRPQVAELLRQRRLAAAARLIDDALLIGELGLTGTQVTALRDGHAELASRRAAHGRAPRGRTADGRPARRPWAPRPPESPAGVR